ncbi:adenylylsulfatase HINT3-like [Durio zibethinus]|uniref:Adenylylsulfatase HINT3-like n=1 Tax=Durio zibethinus TaxID=66656 RepID=A0A6P5XJF5_DURZI|nr:adenylylsulfatase HINT3-like [Durio zibethinus]
MEVRRLAILSSHLCPSRSGYFPARSSTLSASGCASERRSVLDSSHESFRNDCVFCQIIRGESPLLKLYEDDMSLCILDTSPLSRGHSLIIPKSHFSSLDTTPPSVVAAMCSKVPFIGNAIMKATGSDSFNLLVNNGAAAGQVIFHTHIHIIPRKTWDCLWTSESLHRRPLKLDQETSGLANRVRELLINISEVSKDQVSSLS